MVKYLDSKYKDIQRFVFGLSDPIEAIIEALKEDGKVHSSKLKVFNILTNEAKQQNLTNLLRTTAYVAPVDQTEQDVTIIAGHLETGDGASEQNDKEHCGKRKYVDNLDQDEFVKERSWRDDIFSASDESDSEPDVRKNETESCKNTGNIKENFR